MPSKLRPSLTLLPLVVSLAVFAPTLVPSAWSAPKYKVLHVFTGRLDGVGLWGSLLLDSIGNVYGTTGAEGSYGGGTVFELIPNADGTWSETILHDFNGTDGARSTAGLIFDVAGNLYGTTYGCRTTWVRHGV